jgi:hypothetical protein
MRLANEPWPLQSVAGERITSTIRWKLDGAEVSMAAGISHRLSQRAEESALHLWQCLNLNVLPHSPMNEDSGEQKSEASPAQKDKPKEPEKLNGSKRRSRVSKVLFYGGLFAWLAAWAGLLGNLGHTSWIFAACIMLAASVCGALGLRLELRNHHWEKWQYDGAAWTIVLTSFFLGGCCDIKGDLSQRTQTVSHTDS